MITLSTEERLRFAQWCRERAAGNTELAVQMKKIKTPAMIVERYEAEAKALCLVAHVLGAITEDTL